MRHAFLFFLVSTVFTSAFSQGCSDAGFCSINHVKPTNQDSSTLLKNRLSLGIGYGLGDFGVTVTTPYIEYQRSFGANWSAGVKVGYLIADGKLAVTSDLSDAYLTVARALWKQKIKTSVSLKLPFNDGNKSHGFELPMNYQTSLGTVDLIAALTYLPFKGFGVTVALQQPLTQNNNQFDPTSKPYGLAAQNYQTTSGYHRKGDFLLRVNYTLPIIKNKLELTPGLLPIYHLDQDSYVDQSGIRHTIMGSEGLTFNANLFVVYKLNSKNILEFSYGSPLVARKARPDGLTRKYVFAVEYKILF
jgi:hypothetical protein